MLETFLKTLSDLDRKRFNEKYVIDSESKFSKKALEQLAKNCKRNIKPSSIKNSKIILFDNNDITLDGSDLNDCYFFGSNVTIKNSNLKEVSIVACPFFKVDGITMGECHFQNGTKEIKQSNPLIFNFEGVGSIMNPEPDKIDFFGYINTYDYFLKRLDEYPYSEYYSELNSIILMGSRGGR